MRPDMSKLAKRSLAGARLAWPVLLAALVAAVGGYQLAAYRLQPLAPPFAFTNDSAYIEANGRWKSAGSNVPNAADVFCSFPAGGCQVIVAQLVPAGLHPRFQVVGKTLNIIQLSDATLTATSSSTDPCQVETLHIDRKAESATLSVGPAATTTTCVATPPLTATLGA